MSAPPTRTGALEPDAEDLVLRARQLGERLGFPPEVAATVILEKALAFSYAEAAHFRGGNDGNERLERTVLIARARFDSHMAPSIRQFHFLLKGQSTFK